MIKYLYRTLLVGALLVSVATQLWAQSGNGRVIGAEITYKSLGGNQYEVTLNAYRDCASISGLANQYQITYSGVAPTVGSSFPVNLVDITEVNLVCPGQASICNGGTLPGTKRHTYRGTVNLPHNSPRWFFSWSLGSRSSAITTSDGINTKNVYVEAMLNNLDVPFNNSPTFSSEPLGFLCTNQAQSVSLGAVETDNGQTLRYSLVAPRFGTASSEVITYNQGFSASQFLTSSTPIILNPNTGNLSLSPTTIQVSTTALLVEELQNGIVIGSTIRDFQVATRACDNGLPSITGINGTNNFVTSTCAGVPVQFNIAASDPDLNQTIFLSWDQGINGAAFTPSGPNATFSWTPSVTEAGTKTFVVTVKDNACPVPGVQTYNFSVEVNPAVKVKLRNDTTIACNITLPLIPIVTGGTPPFTYLWLQNQETTPIVNKGIGNYSVRVTDAKGCTATASVSLKKGLNADFKVDSVCVGVIANFKDLSTTAIAGAIVNKWQWNFGDAAVTTDTSTLRNPKYTYTVPGVYTVSLRAFDNTNCNELITKTIKVCGIPKANFKYLDSCQLKPLTIQGIPDTSLLCPITTWTLVDNRGNTLTNSTGNFALQYADSGEVDVKLTVYNANGCSNFTQKTIRVYPRPKVNIIDTNYYFKCNSPDSIITATATAFPANKKYKIEWSTGNDGVLSTSGTNNVTTKLSQTGFYTITVTDTIGCTCKDDITVIKPLSVDFSANRFCEPNNAITFTNSSTSEWGVKAYKWKLNHNNQTRTTVNTQYTYPNPQPNKIYNVTLIVTDNRDCVDSITKNVTIALPTGNFSVNTNTPTDTICFGGTINYQAPQGPFVNSWFWKFSNTDSMLVTDPALSNGTHTYNQAGTFLVKLKLSYNDDGNGTCVREYSRKVVVRNPFVISATALGICAGAPTTFSGTKDSGDNPVTSWNWQFFHTPIGTSDLVPIGTANTQNASVTLRVNGLVTARLKATDSKGCVANIERTIIINDVAKPFFTNEGYCVGKPIRFSIQTASDTFENITVYKYIFDDGTELLTNTGQAFHEYSQVGTYNIRLIAYSQEGCQDSSVTPLVIKSAPVPTFTADTVCNNVATSFQGGVLTPDPTATYEWQFGDGATGAGQNATHKFATAGTFNTRLIVTSLSGCRDTTTIPVVVKQNPIAGFSFREQDLLANSAIPFTDESQFAAKWVWTFGDNSAPVRINSPQPIVSHTYNKADLYTITQVVESNAGCKDSTSKTIDLNAYFAVPSAYSPNGDNLNDRFRVRGKAIKQLTDFKIFNRWGQIVFDASGDLQKGVDGWDGKFNGVEQPSGVYVVYAAIKTEYGQEVVLKANLTLLR